MSTDPKNWASEFATYRDFQRSQSQGAAFRVEVDASALRDVLTKLAASGVEMQGAIKAVAFELLARIARRTPVRTGRLRNSFHVVEPGSAADSYEYSDNHGDGFEGGLEDGHTDAFTAFVGTNVIYALAIEAGHSKQAPEGMVAISVAEMTGALEAKLQEVLDRIGEDS